jgi:hypothetical protein
MKKTILLDKCKENRIARLANTIEEVSSVNGTGDFACQREEDGVLVVSVGCRTFEHR